ncbi:AsnC family protein [Pelagicoccus mobilis]|nr:AsnC family protein [Pelagicoccus mobilis]
MKPQDIVVALKLLLVGEKGGSYAVLASELGMSASEVHAAVKRLREGRLVPAEGMRVARQPFRNFLVSGVAHVFPAKEGAPARGIATAWGAPVLKGQFGGNSQDVPVWPDGDGNSRGPSVEPLYRSVPVAARMDPELYDCLALVDTVRLGRARERKVAIEKLDERILSNG